LFASSAPYFEARLAAEIGYANALGLVTAAVLLLSAVVIALGRERAAVDFDAPEG
jgi:hypothetical protein